MSLFSILNQLIVQLRWQDIIDILLVYMIVYRLLLLIRGTRAVQILTGLGIVSVSFLISDYLKLYVFNYLLQQFFDYLFLIVIILFQDEIRRALANVGRNPFLSGPSAQERAVAVLDEVAKASKLLAAKRVGALIVLERQHGLKNYSDGATEIDANVSAELLISIFNTASPIHDGAVIIQGNKILSAGVFFPLNIESEMDRNFGTRHRAALAISEETDAVVVVCSEERGEISLVEYGDISRNLSVKDLRDRLNRAFDLLDPQAVPEESGKKIDKKSDKKSESSTVEGD